MMPSLTYRVVRFTKLAVRLGGGNPLADVYEIARRGLDFASACRDARDILADSLRSGATSDRLFVQCETIPASQAHTVLAGRFTFMA
jgi:hypothetical protein